jgi:hypothetical protein
MSQKGHEDILDGGLGGDVQGEDGVVDDALGACTDAVDGGLIELRW